MIQGGLFTRDFLLEGVLDEPVWKALDEDHVLVARERVETLLRRIIDQKAPNEAETEKQLIFPLLEAIGWTDHTLVQQNLSAVGRVDVPDALLFGDTDALDRARLEQPWQRFQHGVCMVESKRWDRPLDRPLESRMRRKGEEGVPSAQMLRYLRRADDITRGKLRWGMLTNGRLWRLYWHGSVSVSEDFLEIDLGKIFGLPGCNPDLLDPRDVSPDHIFRLFLLLFGREAFLPSEHGTTFHELAHQSGKRWEERVARDLSRVVFKQVFPVLTDALAAQDRDRPVDPGAAWLEEVRQGALILLYRLLFVLYAEDRNLLPDETGPYKEYALTRIRHEIAQSHSDGRPPSPRAAIYWARLRTIFTAISEGDDELGVPPYNGGLFDPATAPILERVELTDKVLAEVIFALSHVEGDRGPKYVNYRDLSVQQLGSIYERILEYGLRVESDGRVVVDADADERHDSGSFYTPEALVALIVDQAVGPLVKDRVEAFTRAAEALGGDNRPVEVRLAELAVSDPAVALLELKVCDPAMGSGHFLVSLVDWLADRVLEATAEAAAQVEWGEYISPLSDRIAVVRDRILKQARDHGWPIVQEQLDDRHVVRRMIIKRVIHGVDKNPMAVELAKVALWLHTFTVGAPLSFLDHHLRCGDSVVGAWVRPTLDAVAAAGGLLAAGQVARVENVARSMSEIEATTDNDVAEVRASKATFGVIEEATHELDAFFSLITASPMLGVDFNAKRPRETAEAMRAARASGAQKITDDKIVRAVEQQTAFDKAAGFKAALGGEFGDPIKIATGEIMIAAPDEGDDSGQAVLLGGVGDELRQRRLAAALVRDARALAARERFLHWPLAFPNVWQGLDQTSPSGGFDAVIGNPPYVRQEKLSSVKQALAASYSVYAGMADLYVYFFEQGLRLVKPGGRVAYVVNNKWLKAGYAEELRALLTDPAKAQTDALIDFGHAKNFFSDADVFPNVAVFSRPDGAAAPEFITVSVPARDTKPDENLAAIVEAASFPLRRAALSREGWTLEPKPVMDLLEKLKRVGIPLTQFAGVKPYRGVLTGFNDAFLIDTPTKDRLVAQDSACIEIIKPYLRGQDVERWSPDWKSLWMIFTRRGIDIDRYPSVKAHLERFRGGLEPKPTNWTPSGPKDEWAGRKRGDYAWYEIQDSVAYWREFEKPKIIYQEIQYHPSFALDRSGIFSNNKTFFIATDSLPLLATLNSPLMWWFNWRYLPHMKDEALSPMGFLFEHVPVATPDADVTPSIERLTVLTNNTRAASHAIRDWLKIEYGIERPGRVLEAPMRLDADGFAAAVRAVLPKRRNLSAAEVGRLKQEHSDTIEPARLAAAEAATLERGLSELVNDAYGLTADEVRLMWQTAPPRMPLVAPTRSTASE